MLKTKVEPLPEFPRETSLTLVLSEQFGVGAGGDRDGSDEKRFRESHVASGKMSLLFWV